MSRSSARVASAAAPSRRRHDEDFVLVVEVAVALAPEGDLRSVGRVCRSRGIAVIGGQRGYAPALDVEHLHARLIERAEGGGGHLRDQQLLAVRRPRERRRLIVRRQAPGARGHAPGSASVRRHHPHVKHRRGGGREVVVVANLEGVVVGLDRLLVRRLVGRDVGDVAPVRAPRELLDAFRGVRDLSRIAAAHREDEELGLRGLARAGLAEEREPVAARRPARRGHVLAPVGQRPRARARGRQRQEHELALPRVVLDVGARDDADDGFPIRRDLRVRHAHDPVEVGNLHAARRAGKRRPRNGKTHPQDNRPSHCVHSFIS